MSRRIRWWFMGIGGLIVAGCGVWLFVNVGLDKSDKIASAVGPFIGLAGLAVSIYGVHLARRQAAPAPAGGRPAIQASGERSVAAWTIFGDVKTGDGDDSATRADPR